MSAFLGLPRSVVDQYTLKELVVSYEASLIEKWNHTAQVCCQVYNLSVMVVNMMGSKKVKPRSPENFHPFVKAKVNGLEVKKENFGDLKTLANVVLANKKR